MVYVTASRHRTPIEFILARIIRIVPLYWFYTFGVALLMYVAPALYHSNELSVRHLVLSLLFIPHNAAVFPSPIQPMVKAGWTLLYEMFFYSVFAIAMVVSYQRRVAIAAVAIVAVVAMNVIAGPFSSEALANDTSVPFFVSFFGSQIVLEFVLGMLVAVYYLRGPRLDLSRWVGTGIVLLGFATLYCVEFVAGSSVESNLRFVSYGISAALIVLASLLMERACQIQ